MRYRLLTPLVAVGLSAQAAANPTGAVTTQGNAVVTTSGTQVTVQTDGRAVINWQSFSIGANETTHFEMSGTDRAVLNRVVTATPSQIDGVLQANGRVYLINPNGVLIGAGGHVQTQGFIASTRDVTDSSFMAGGELTFSGTSAHDVENLGTIDVTDGDAVLIGQHVSNRGVINALQGVVALAAGDEVMLAAPGSERLLVRVEGVAPGSAGTQVDQMGAIHAVQAELAAVGGNMLGLAVNAGGTVTATGVTNHAGRIYLTSEGGQIAVPGVLTARNRDNTGGTIDLDSGLDFPGQVNLSGTLDVSSTSRGGDIFVDGIFTELEGTTRLLASGDSTAAGSINLGTRHETGAVTIAQGALFQANSEQDAGVIDIAAGSVKFGGSIEARGRATLGTLNIATGESISYTGLADLRATDDSGRLGDLHLTASEAGFAIDRNDRDDPMLLNADVLQTQLEHGNVEIVASRAGETVGVFAPLSWQGSGRLSLDAHDDLQLEQAINAADGALSLRSRSGAVSVLEPATLTLHDLWLSAGADARIEGALTASNVTLADVVGRSSLPNEQNRIDSVEIVRGSNAASGDVSLVDSAGGLSLSVQYNGGAPYSVQGDFTARTVGDLTLEEGFQARVAGNVTLVAAGGTFRNHSTVGSDAFGDSTSGLVRTRVYSASPAEAGGIAGATQYDVSYPADPATAEKTVFYYSGGAPANPPDTNPPDTNPPDTNPPDTNPPDTNPPDTNPPGTNPPDTHPPDTNPPDTNPPDTHPPDTNPPDTNPPDTHPPDTNPPDTNPPGTNPPDTRPPDTNPPDTNPPDTHPPDTSPPDTRPPDTTPPATNPPGAGGPQPPSGSPQDIIQHVMGNTFEQLARQITDDQMLRKLLAVISPYADKLAATNAWSPATPGELVALGRTVFEPLMAKLDVAARADFEARVDEALERIFGPLDEILSQHSPSNPTQNPRSNGGDGRQQVNVPRQADQPRSTGRPSEPNQQDQPNAHQLGSATTMTLAQELLEKGHPGDQPDETTRSVIVEMLTSPDLPEKESEAILQQLLQTVAAHSGADDPRVTAAQLRDYLARERAAQMLDFVARNERGADTDRGQTAKTTTDAAKSAANDAIQQADRQAREAAMAAIAAQVRAAVDAAALAAAQQGASKQTGLSPKAGQPIDSSRTSGTQERPTARPASPIGTSPPAPTIRFPAIEPAHAVVQARTNPGASE